MNKDTLSDIPTGTLVQGAVEVIERLILEGSIKPGEHLREKELESRVGISRTPIREALRCLESHGLAESFPRKGCCVRTISLKSLYDTMEVGIALEEATLRLAHKRINPKGIEALKVYIKGLRASARRKSPTYSLDAETRFIDLLNNLAKTLGSPSNCMFSAALRSGNETPITLSIPTRRKPLNGTRQSRRCFPNRTLIRKNLCGTTAEHCANAMKVLSNTRKRTD